MTFTEAKKYLEKHCFCKIKKINGEWEMQFKHDKDDKCYDNIVKVNNKQEVIEMAIALEDNIKEFEQL